MLPNTYLIGAPKAGTTSLARWLAEHPDVFVSTPKEPFFWASDFPDLRRHYGYDTREAYERLFSGKESAQSVVRAEGSTVYLYSHTAVPDILRAVPDARFIVALRDPVDLVISYHRTQVVALNESAADFETAWRRSLSGGLPATRPLDDKLVDYPRVAGLGAAVSRLMGWIPAGRLHVVWFDELRCDPAATYRRLVEFLELSSGVTPSFVHLNASTKTPRSRLARRLTHRPPKVIEAPVRRLRQIARTSEHQLVASAKQALWRPAARPEITAAVRREVALHLVEDVALLGDLLRTDLTKRWQQLA